MEYQVYDDISTNNYENKQSRGRNAGRLEYWDACIHEVINKHSLTQPDAEAICSEADGTLSYLELDQVCTRLAHHLVTLGVGPEVLVPIVFEKSIWNVVSMLGVLKAGGAFVPLDWNSPRARLQTLVGKIGTSLLLCSQKQAASLAGIVPNVLPIDSKTIEELPDHTLSKPLPGTLSRNLAYMIYTSGSTGEPKGVLIEHRAFCSGARVHAPAMLMKPTSRVLQFAAHVFDASLVEILTTLMVGGTICIPTEDVRLNDVVGFINRTNINWAVLTPSFIGLIDPTQVTGLRDLVLAGEAMSQTHLNSWCAAGDDHNLVNGYGPSEASVCCAANSHLTPKTAPSNIGFQVGCNLYIVDPDDHNLLLNDGSLGELVIQGPTLARGYHNDPQKTDASFIQSPSWASETSPDNCSWRMYKTGDLVRKEKDGTYYFVGRKDTQVKVHGQRVELGEVEHHIYLDPNIKHTVVLLPKQGALSGRLVALLSFNSQSAENLNNDDDGFHLLQDSSTEIRQIHVSLSSLLPAHMVPVLFIAVQAIPFLPSRKIDRARTMRWLEEVTPDLYRRIVGISGLSEATPDVALPRTEIERNLRSIWSQVLNVPLEDTDLNRTFITYGGDSISALQFKSRCLKKNININVQDILKSSIAQLADKAKSIDHTAHQQVESIEQSFALSPIQKLFFELPGQGEGHFNQSFFLRLTRNVQKRDLRMAVETIIRHHSMLRARFSRSAAGVWTQRITDDINGSYRLKTHKILAANDAASDISITQESLNIIDGPLFGVDVFDVEGEDQLLFMVGHHLVLDLVSWRVILEDIEELLQHPHSALMRNPCSFQAWCNLQVEQSSQLPIDKVLPIDIPSSDDTFWGIRGRRNDYGSVTREGFEVDCKTTSMLLTQSHTALRTETIDLLLSALIHSFSSNFPDRAVPAIYNESHGRQTSGIDVDLSRTVGWFTTMYPVRIPSLIKDYIEVVRYVKDLRAKTPDNGRQYFACRLLTDEGKTRFGHHWPLEITFNFLGQYQQLEREGALLKPVNEMAGETRGAGGTADVGQNTPRFGLFEISAVIVQGKLRFSFTFNRNMKHQDRILRWISSCRQAIIEMTNMLAKLPQQVTLADFPLLSLNYEQLERMVYENLPRKGISDISNVESIYPCSPIQEGILISQLKETTFYGVHIICELKTHSSIRSSADRLAQAWQKVVRRHAILRTIFIESLSASDGIYDQIVLQNYDPKIVQVDCSSDSYALRILGTKQAHTNSGPAHLLTICETSQKALLFKLEISHALIDGESMSIILRDLRLAYEGKLNEVGGPLYSDYISFLQVQPNAASISYWNSYLADVEPCIFPILNDGIEIEKQLRSHRLEFVDDKFRVLKQFCADHGVTLSNALHAAWGLTLRCYTETDDVIFGYLVSSRDIAVPGIEDLVGPTIHLLVSRMNMNRSHRLEEILDSVQRDYTESLPHRYTALAEVQHILQRSGGAIFNTALSYQRVAAEVHEATEISFEERLPIYDPTEYPLSINVVASDDNLTIDLDYWTDAISENQAAHIASTFLQSIQNIIHHSNQSLEQLSWIGEHSRTQIGAWNSYIPKVIDECVHNMITDVAQRQPLSPAISAWDAELSYFQLDELSTRLAHHLLELGVEPRTFIPTCFDKSAWAIVATMAILKSGASAVPIDPAYPKSAIQHRLQDTGCRFVVTNPSRAHIFEEMGPFIVSVSRESLDSLPTKAGENLFLGDSSQPCFIIYTSGSTGSPKGVILEHRSIVTSAQATGDVYGFDSSTRVLQFANYTFDNSLAEIYFTLMRGGCVCVPSEDQRMNSLVEVINTMDVNFMDITPTVATFLRPSEVPKLKAISLGGEPVTKENIETWGNAMKLYCCYGPSECCVNSTWNGDLLKSYEATNIGRSIGSISWVVDPLNHDHLVPVGNVGELVIEGPILARGYLNDNDKTSKVFITDPAWIDTPGHRMYKTGDLVRQNSDGSLTYLGRKDTQIKLNGQRVELGEVEHHVQNNFPPEAHSAVELIKLGSSRKSALATFFCLQSNSSIASDCLTLPMAESLRSVAAANKDAVATAVPAHMVPTLYIPMSNMPMTLSGKLDRRRLRNLGDSIFDEQANTYRLAQKSSHPPSTIMEKKIAELWAKVLDINISSIGASDNFFRLGGDSVGAMRLITAARLQGIALTVAAIFAKPVLSDIAVDVGISSPDNEAGRAINPFSLLKNINSVTELKLKIANQCRVDIESFEDVLPCTAIQEGLIALSNKDPGAYVAQNTYRLPANIDVEKFKAAWNTVIQAESILRTRIVFVESLGFFQVVLREATNWHDLASVREAADLDRALPAFNGAPLCHYAFVHEIDNPQFVWTAHHALYDGWSIPLLLEKVEACYHDPSRKLDPGPIYARFIEYISNINEAESVEHWKDRLAELEASQFPILPHPSYQVQSTCHSSHTAFIVREAGSQITLPSIIRAAWAMVVSIYSGSTDDVIFGEILTGRDAPVPGIIELIGPTLATVPTRIRINHDESIGKFLEYVQQRSAEAILYQFAGLQKIRQINEATRVACNFQNLLAIHHETKEPDGFWDSYSTGTTIGTNFYSYPLTVSCQIGEGKVEIDAHYDQDIISSWEIEKVLQQFGFILGLLARPQSMDQRLSDLSMLNLTDQADLLAWNHEPLQPVSKCVHQLFEQQVCEQPESKIAVDAWDATLTYRELDGLSTRLAKHLMILNTGAALIPLCFDKSAWTIVAMLGILKSGNAFIPLDSATPVSRLQNIVSDAKSSLILCSSRYQQMCSTLVPNAFVVDSRTIEKLPGVPPLKQRWDDLPVCDSHKPAYVIFTSGTTGRPKGTVVQHGAFCAGAAAHAVALHMQNKSRVLQFASYSFDASLLEILTTLIFGATVCVPSSADRMNNITKVINDMNITWTLLTPSFIQLIQPSQVPTLQTLVLGGEAMSQGHVSTWADKLELINAYGPSECAVVATANPHMSLFTDPANMGRPVGCWAWLTDPHNHDKLAPVGSIGELVIEGPILAQEYLNDKQKTAESFIENPKWCLPNDLSVKSTTRRMYKTGDLAKFSKDGNGSLIFCGRKDTQVKLHGQRLELSEVEHHLQIDQSIRHVQAIIPTNGHCKKRLVAILSLQERTPPQSSTARVDVVARETSAFYLPGIKERLCDKLPSYMIPSYWIILHSLPLLPSGKLDRRHLNNWVENITQEMYQQISDIDHVTGDSSGTALEYLLQTIWGKALNLPAEKIGLHQSFLHLGGDSISAMQVMSACRSQDIGVTVQDIIQCKSISKLAQCVTQPEKNSYEAEFLDALFDLSPIQKLYFECVGENWQHFNQSITLKLTKKVNLEDMKNALNVIVTSHHMLRARFTQDEAGSWHQRILPYTEASYRYREQIATMETINTFVEKSQNGLDIQNGPVFAIDLFDIEGEDEQLISMVAHHLVVDVVSWRIILQDLEDLLISGKAAIDSSLPFQTWARLQLEHTQQSSLANTHYPEDTPVANFAYWDMATKANTYGDIIEDTFDIDPDNSLLLLRRSNNALNTEPIDVFLASVITSFRKVFSDRSAPVVFSEGHGREVWESSNIDISHTVGWFTTMCPISLPSSVDGETDIVNTIRWIKDLRNRIPGKGRPYFASRLLTVEGEQRFSGHWPMEITFNYLGKLQQLERPDALLQEVAGVNNADYDIGSNVPRFSLFEISARVTHGTLKFSFSYNKKMKRQAKIRRWVVQCQRTLQEAAQVLAQMKPERTLSDFPLIPLSYNGMTKLVQTLPQLGASSLDEVAEVYPCSPMQQGMLLAQLKDQSLYAYSAIFEVQPSAGLSVDARHLSSAWQDVVQRHSSLRTIFIESIGGSSLMEQVVLKEVVARISFLRSSSSRVTQTFASQDKFRFRDKQPPHRFSICETNEKRIFCRIEISHAISDGTSITILLRDLSDAYKSRVPARDGPTTCQGDSLGHRFSEVNNRALYTVSAPRFSDYISYTQSKSAAENLNYWKAYLTDVEPCNFPALTDGRKPQREIQSHVLELTQPTELKSFCTKHGYTLSNVLQLVWALVLRTYTGNTDVSFGYLTSGRDAPIPGIQDSGVGAFINILICRMDLNASLTLNQALDQVQTDFVHSMAYQACSLADIQHELQLSGTSLFNTAFTFQRRTSAKESTLPMLSFEIIDTRDPSEYDVTVNVEQLDTKVEIHFGYWSHILSTAQAMNMAKTFDHVLNSIINVQTISHTIAKLDLLSDDSRTQIMRWNSTKPAKVDRCIHEMISEHALNRPISTPAIDAWDGKMTFSELEAVTNRLSNRLIEFGIGPENYVPLAFEKSIYMVIAIIAVMKAGAAFVPLDPGHPEGRLKHFIVEVRASLVLCSSMHEKKIAGVATQVLTVNRLLIEGLVDVPSLSPSAVRPTNAAYIIFTSGTTGMPKGTIIEHVAFCTSATEHAKAMCMHQDSRVFQFASHTFDASVMEILSTLIAGGCVCIPSDMERMNDIPGAIQRMGVTWTLLTPSVANTLSPKTVPSLRTLVTGGEAMHPDHITKWRGKLCLINAYGPSETSVIASTSMKVDEAGNALNSDASNIGEAVGGRNWIVDPQNFKKLVPVGGIGELVVEGHTVARGYLNNEEKTAHAFVTQPKWFQGINSQERLYRTGDLVRYNSDGTLSFVARKDTQIKLRGQRIELGEIEYQVKLNLPSESQSAVELVTPNQISSKALAVFFCLPDGGLTDQDEKNILASDEILLPMSKISRRIAKHLDSSLATVLPPYMIPSFYVPIRNIPWTTSGKLDRTRLRNLIAALPKEETPPYRLLDVEDKQKLESGLVAATSMERKLQEIWRNVMNVESVGLDDNFFRLGGDSVQSMKIVQTARLEGISLSVLDIFRNPKLSDMALKCGVLEDDDAMELKQFSLLETGDIDAILDEIVSQSKLEKDEISNAYPASALQQGLLTLSIRQRGAYVLHNKFKLLDDIDIDRFKSAWQEVVDEVDILRTRIVHLESGKFIQVVVKPAPITWHTAVEAEDYNIEDPKLPTHVGGELTYYKIVDSGNGKNRFFHWSIHHCLYDGWSLPMVLSRVQSCYLESNSSFPKASYASFINYLTNTDVKVSDDFWRNRLAGAEPLQFPQTSHSETQTRNSHSLAHSVRLLERRSKIEVTIPTVIRAAWSLIVATYSGSDDVVFGETLSGRDISVPNIADIIGPIFTTCPTRIQVDREITIDKFLHNVHQMATDIIPYQHAGVQNIKKLDTHTELACDFQNLLVIQTAEEEAEDEFWIMDSNGVGGNFFTYPLVLECKASMDNTKVDIIAHFDANIISKWQVQRILFQLDTVIAQLSLSVAAQTVGEVQIFSPEDKLLLEEANSKTASCLDSTIPQEFEKIALSQPQAPAICGWDGEFTYYETYEHAVRLAKRLITLGVGPEQIVPICMEKSAWATISMLAVMFAGGAYSPLDPAAPFSRHQEMIEDLGAKVIICGPRYGDKYSSLVNEVVVVDAAFIISLHKFNEPALPRSSSKSPAYVIFTSGSTGKPKGCVVEHGAISTSSIAMRKAMLMEKGARVLQFASYTFDVSVLEMFTTLTYGGVLCIPSEAQRTSSLSETIVALKVQWAFLTPSVANLINPSAVPDMKVLVCGGEAMSLENVARWGPHVRLVNGYGPTEASVIALANNAVSSDRSPANIGHALAGNLAWVVDSTDHNRLAPVGCIGELILEGPILAREYIKNPEKTSEVFIRNPSWISLVNTAALATPRRMYKTGDLVRYNEDLSVTFIGRKDNQVKLHGQRMELGEVENSLDIDPKIRHALAALPQAGHFKKRLVAIISLTELSFEKSTAGSCEIVHDGPKHAIARSEVTKAKTRLSERLPEFMIPSTWIVIKALPLLPSGKLDRKLVASWLERIDEKTYEQIMETDDEEDNTLPVTDTSLLLQEVFSRVLNLPLSRVKLSSSFLSLGGDSITAMQVMALCRKESLNFSLAEVLRSKSIIQLANSARYEGERVFEEERIEEEFALSPIQQFYFNLKSADQQIPDSRFNQSFTLRITRAVEVQQIRDAIHSIVLQHSMLRAKFSKAKSGVWQQHITKDESSSYRFNVHDVEDGRHVAAVVGNSQSSLDIQKGPLFSVDLFRIVGQDQILFLAAHHLIIDMVSWRIILGDLELFLNTGKLLSARLPLSFQTWLSLQTEHSKELGANKRLSALPSKVEPSDLEFWGMSNRPNTYGDVICKAFTVDERVTAFALGESNISLRTEPVEIFLTAIAHSFSRVFERKVPALWIESHGRESWDSTIDISTVVGWFTSMFPIQIAIDTDEDDVVDSVKHIKDLRRKIQDNGRPYFAQRYLTTEGKSNFKDHEGTMEILFNYLGRMQQLEHDDSLLQPWTYPDNTDERMVADVGPQAERFALFEISASIIKDQIQFSILYNKSMKHQQDIERWVLECHRTLEETILKLASIRDEVIFTLSDFPLLPISYEGLEKITSKSLPQVGINPAMVETIYPCAPLQEGLILSQIKDPSLYHFSAVFVVNPAPDGSPVDARKLLKAWQEVVNYHGALRIVFADSVYKGDIFNQIVVKQADSGAILIQCDESEALDKLSKVSILDHNYKKQPRLPHQITIAECTSGRVYFKGEINHGVIDGASANIMLRDLAAAYHENLPPGPGPSYGDYVAYIKTVQDGAGKKFWKNYLTGVRPCYFPKLNEQGAEKSLHSAPINFDRFPELQAMCKKMKVTLANVTQAAWALCLREYTKSEDVCFGNLTSGRDVPVPGVQETIGAFINMLVCRVKFNQQPTLKEVYQKVQQDYIESLEFQHTSLAQVQHDLTGGNPLFNTAVSIQKGAASDEAEESGTISFDPILAHDPGEFAITLNVRTFINDEGMLLRYWTNFISDGQAANVASKMALVLENFVNRPHQTVEELDLSAERAKPAVKVQQPLEQPPTPQVTTSEDLQTLISQTVREVIEQMFRTGTLVSYGKQEFQDTLNIANRQIVQPVQPAKIAQPMIDYSQLTPEPLSNKSVKVKRSTAGLAPPLKVVDSQVERKLLTIWSNLLQISEDSILADDSFFALGGDSILAMQMVGIARDEDLALTVASIFRHPTFADLARVVQLADATNAPLDITGLSEYKEIQEIRAQTIQNSLYQPYSLLETTNAHEFVQDNISPKARTFRGGIIDVFPVTDFQALAVTGTLMEAKWMLNYFHLSGDGPLDLKKFKAAIYRLVETFEILRTVFVPYGNRFYQVVLRKLQPTILVQECDDLDDYTASLQKSDQGNGPRLGESFLKFAIAKEKGSLRHRIIIRMSHAQYDGVCMPTILAGLQKGYQGLSISSPPPYSGYVRDAARKTTDEHYTYWQSLLKGSTMTDVVRRSGPNYKRGGKTMSLKRIVQFSSLATEAVTPATVIKAAWSLVLAKMASSSDIVFGNVISGRNASVMGIENIVGPCVNMVPVRVSFKPDWTVLDLLHHVQDQQVANMPYESLGFRQIIKHCTDWKDWTNFSTVCQHQNIQRQGQLVIGKTEYVLGAIGSQEDFADITILSTPQDDEKIEISLIFTENSGAPAAIAEKLFEQLCATSVAFSDDPHTALPTASELSGRPSQVLEYMTPPVDTALAANLRGINRDELLVYNDILARAWRQILWDKKGNLAIIDLDSSFYELGGDIIGIAQLASLLEAEGFKLRVEDLVDHPLMVEQLALCALYTKRKQAEEADLAPAVEGSVEVEKKGLKKMLGKTAGLKKIFHRKGKNSGPQSGPPAA
ncbi:nonribosomal peptide synthase [Bisporella sp. PMI_857]|nr:nonribosomal peptide synthase [Bisporella sp. PMI_857]